MSNAETIREPDWEHTDKDEVPGLRRRYTTLSRKFKILSSGSCDVDNTECTKLLFTHLPSWIPVGQYEEFLKMFFGYKTKKYCFAIASVENIEESSVIVEFEDSEAVNLILEMLPIRVMGTSIDVEVVSPEPPCTCTIEVSGPSYIMRKHILELYFESTKRSGGDDIEMITVFETVYNEDDNVVALVTFESEKVALRVFDKGNHQIDGTTLDVRLCLPEKKVVHANDKTKDSQTQTQTGRDSIHEPECTIVVLGSPSIIVEHTLELYFENTDRSGGDDIVKIELDDVFYEIYSVAFIKFKANEVAKRVIDSGNHRINNSKVHVQMYECLIPEEEKHSREYGSTCTVEVLGPPNVIVRHVLELYFENTKRSGGGDIDMIEVNEETYRCVAYVTFESKEVANRVVRFGKHEISKYLLEVHLYNDFVNEPEYMNVPQKYHASSRSRSLFDINQYSTSHEEEELSQPSTQQEPEYMNVPQKYHASSRSRSLFDINQYSTSHEEEELSQPSTQQDTPRTTNSNTSEKSEYAQCKNSTRVYPSDHLLAMPKRRSYTPIPIPRPKSQKPF